ncbi:MAG: hypothetical protein FWG65_00305, partial [Turicibacter sp.]|nr:hypothetical protein [Turicibacter sp.]
GGLEVFSPLIGILKGVMKMYEVLKNPQKMTREEIREKYDGKWLFVVRKRGESYCSYENEIPVVVADTAWEGRETGIYQGYLHDSQWITAGDLSLLPRDPNMFYGFWEVPVNDGN